MIFALTLLPVLSAIGCVIDYSRATQLRSKLQSSIDSASVGTACNAAPIRNIVRSWLAISSKRPSSSAVNSDCCSCHRFSFVSTGEWSD